MKDLESSSAPSAFSLSTLPSSLTTLLLSILDSPAYANLSTHYLERVFNPSTPDDPRVRYYSVAARTSSIGLLHPLWLPKVVLDSTENEERKHAPKDIPPDDWGNDGLVNIRSARWGEFLGTLEGVDHWDIRGGSGAFGFNANGEREWGVDLSLPSGIRNSLSDPFSQFPTAWREIGRLIGAKSSAEDEKRERESAHSKNISDNSDKENEANAQQDDAVVKSSTDKMSAVLDWLSDQAPFTKSNNKDSDALESQNPPKAGAAPAKAVLAAAASGIAPSSVRRASKEREAEGKKEEQTAHDPHMKFDLERFYIALTRKLYDDGF